MRLVTARLMLHVSLEPRYLWLALKASLSSLGHICYIHQTLASIRTSTAFLSTHHYHGIEIICPIYIVFWVSVLAILIVDGRWNWWWVSIVVHGLVHLSRVVIWIDLMLISEIFLQVLVCVVGDIVQVCSTSIFSVAKVCILAHNLMHLWWNLLKSIGPKQRIISVIILWIIVLIVRLINDLNVLQRIILNLVWSRWTGARKSRWAVSVLTVLICILFISLSVSICVRDIFTGVHICVLIDALSICLLQHLLTVFIASLADLTIIIVAGRWRSWVSVSSLISLWLDLLIFIRFHVLLWMIWCTSAWEGESCLLIVGRLPTVASTSL